MLVVVSAPTGPGSTSVMRKVGLSGRAGESARASEAAPAAASANRRKATLKATSFDGRPIETLRKIRCMLRPRGDARQRLQDFCLDSCSRFESARRRAAAQLLDPIAVAAVVVP